MIYELAPKYENVKSYYKKAIVYDHCIPFGERIIKSDNINLLSYGVHVCYIDPEKKVHLLPKWNYSVTILRHVKEFLNQHGIKADSKSSPARNEYRV